jgi:hypothetical protein
VPLEQAVGDADAARSAIVVPSSWLSSDFHMSRHPLAIDGFPLLCEVCGTIASNFT